MKIETLSRTILENNWDLFADVNHIVISITDPGQRKVNQSLRPKSCVDVLSLQFHDIDSPIKDYISFTEEHAKSILKFINKNINNIEMIICHCEGGVSRSAGVSAALHVIFELDDYKLYREKIPNALVKRTILGAHNEI